MKLWKARCRRKDYEGVALGWALCCTGRLEDTGRLKAKLGAHSSIGKATCTTINSSYDGHAEAWNREGDEAMGNVPARLCGNPLPPGSSEVFDSVVHLSREQARFKSQAPQISSHLLRGTMPGTAPLASQGGESCWQRRRPLGDGSFTCKVTPVSLQGRTQEAFPTGRSKP